MSNQSTAAKSSLDLGGDFAESKVQLLDKGRLNYTWFVDIVTNIEAMETVQRKKHFLGDIWEIKANLKR